MSDFNNYPNGGYPQQQMGGYQQPQQMGGYQQPQQMGGYQQPQQPGMGMQPQMGGFQQPQQPGMGMQPQMGGFNQPPKKKSNVGLIIGIIVAVLAIAGLVVFLLRDKIFGEKLKGGYESPEKVVTVFFEAFSAVDQTKMESCFVTSSSTFRSDVDKNIEQGKKINSYTKIRTNEIKVTTSDYSDKASLKSRGYKKLKDAKSFHAEVPMTQDIDGISYDVLDIYDGCVVQMSNGKWYLVDMAETDAQIVDFDLGLEDDLDDLTDIDDVDVDVDDIDLGSLTEDDVVSPSSDMKAVGDDTNGYVDVPSDWIRFTEEGGIDGTYTNVQFTDPDQQAIITLCTYESDAEVEDVAEAMEEATKEDAEDVVLSAAMLGSYSGYKISCYYPDDDEVLVYWMFRAPEEDNLLHYVAVEYIPDGYMAETYVLSSFRFTK